MDTTDKSNGTYEEYDEATQKIFQDETIQASPERVSSTSLQGFHEIIAISEGTLNTVLKTRFQKGLQKNKDGRLRELNHAIPQFGEMKATLAPPHIRLVVEGAPEAVRFYVNFDDGFFEYLVGQGPFVEKRTQPVAGWSIAFNVDFSLKKLASVPDAIRKKVTLLTPGSYDVSQITLGLSVASLSSIDWVASAFPEISKDKDVEIIAVETFKKYFEIYLSWLSNGPYSVLGYTLKVGADKIGEKKLLPPSFPPTSAKKDGEEDRLPPSFPPTSVRCLTQPYCPNTEAFTATFPPTSSFKQPTRGGLDALIFLEMTENRGWPGTLYDNTKAGNWITGSANCSLALSKQVFWDRYFLKKFASLNLQTLTLANDMFHWIMYSRKEPQNDWRVSPGHKPSDADWTSTSNGATFSWTGAYEDKYGLDFDNTYTTIINSMKWQPGSDVVKIEVKIAQKRDFNAAAKGEHSMGHSFVQDTTLEWKLVLRLNTLKAGELETVITYDTPDLKSKRDDSLAWMDWGGLIKHYEDQAISTIKANMNLESIQNQLTNLLNSKGKFVFPGARDFAMREPTFTHNGDLLITLTLGGESLDVDDDFHLQVAAPGQPCDGQWVKVAKDGDGAELVLVATKEEATLLQLSNGKLTVDINQLPKGQRASAGPADKLVEGQKYLLQDVFFNTPKTEKSKPEPKLEFSIAGSGVFFSIDKKYWWTRFVLEGQKLRLFIGNPPAEGVELPVKPFLLQAIY